MSDGFTIGAAMQAPTIFQCPACNETIDSSADACRFCGVTVDHEAASKLAEVLAKVNQACSDASYLRSTSLTLPVFFVLRFIPFGSMLGGLGFVGLSFVIPIWGMRWWLKFGKLDSRDPEFRSARTTVKAASLIVLAVLVVLVILPSVASVLVIMSKSAQHN